MRLTAAQIQIVTRVGEWLIAAKAKPDTYSLQPAGDGMRAILVRNMGEQTFIVRSLLTPEMTYSQIGAELVRLTHRAEFAIHNHAWSRV